MEFTLKTLVLLPVGLGLLGFVEPCTIGGHMLFLGTQDKRSQAEKIKAALVFIIARTFVAGMFGAVIAFLGHKLIGFQKGIWLVFGLIYLIVGIAYLVGRAGLFKKQIDLAPAAWKRARNPFMLGLAFGLNVPACAAPILFGLLGLAATTGNLVAGFFMMALFGLALSAPLLLFAVIPALAGKLDALGNRLKSMRWILGMVFVLLGVWSIWFGLYVDPAKWAGQ